ncbi:hypothetical protein E2542_SST22662 [Spatholobus suberectus]|nr:hypothetical protein E2542_SST22662 [Spatholobus suberectus]
MGFFKADHLIADDFSAELADGLAYVAGHDDESRPVMVHSFAGLYTGGGHFDDAKKRRTICDAFRRKLLQISICFYELVATSTENCGRVLPRPSMQSLCHRPSLAFRLLVEGCSAVRGVISVDDGGIIVGFRRIVGLQRLRGLPASLVPPIRDLERELNGEDRLVLLVAVLLHRISPPGLIEALVPEPDRHVSIESGTHESLARTDLAAERAVALVRVARGEEPPRPPRQQERALPLDPAAAARDGASADLVPAVAGDVLPAREPRRRQGREVPGIVLALCEVLPKTVRRNGL